MRPLTFRVIAASHTSTELQKHFVFPLIADYLHMISHLHIINNDFDTARDFLHCHITECQYLEKASFYSSTQF
jgi:hypothetical protein